MRDRAEKVLAAGMMLAVVFSALAHGAVEAWSVALFQLLLATLFLVWGIKAAFAKGVTINLPKTLWPLLTLVGLGLAQSLSVTDAGGFRRSLSLDVEATRKAVLMILFLVGAYLLIVNLLPERASFPSLVRFFILYGAVLSVIALVQYFTGNRALPWLSPAGTESMASGPFVNHAHFAGYVEMLLPLPLALLVTGVAGKEARLFCALAVFIMGLSLIFSLSRGGMLGAVAGLLFMSILSAILLHRAEPNGEYRGRFGRRRLSTPLLRVGMILGLSAVTVLGVIWIGAEPVIDRLGKASVFGQSPRAKSVFSGRTEIWENTILMIRENPVLGVGLGAYETAYPRYSSQDQPLLVAQSHNDYLQILADGGVVGGLIALWFLVAVFQTIWQSCRHTDPLLAAVALGCATGIVSILTHSLFDFNLQIPANALVFLILVAMLSQIASLARESASTRSALAGG